MPASSKFQHLAQSFDFTPSSIAFLNSKIAESFGKLNPQRAAQNGYTPLPYQYGSKGGMIPGFEEQILEHKAGDEFTIKVQFPSTYHSKECAGKDAEFDIKLNEVLKPQKSEVNDESAKAHRHAA